MNKLKSLIPNLNTESYSLFKHLTLAPVDPILGTTTAFKNDPNPKKMNLGVGAYRDDNGKPYIFKTVRKAENQIVNDPSIDKEYLPIDGLSGLITASQKVAFGFYDDMYNDLINNKKLVTAQTISGTGSLFIGLSFLKIHSPSPVYISNPTWGNHKDIINHVGLPLVEYPYWDPSTRGLNFSGMLEKIANAKPGSIILLHASAHNPTGVDLTEEQWEIVADLIKNNRLIPYFDMAYQGFASGCFKKDSKALYIFWRKNINYVLSQSFAKNFGLYGERVGAIHIISENQEEMAKTLSQLKLVIRRSYSNPPKHGALIIDKIVNNKEMFQEYLQEIKEVSERIISVRKSLRDELERLKVAGDWSHITNQIGMFSYTGLTPEQCEKLISKWHIYLLKNGRISLSGINSKNVNYLAEAIADVVKN